MISFNDTLGDVSTRLIDFIASTHFFLLFLFHCGSVRFVFNYLCYLFVGFVSCLAFTWQVCG